MNGRKKTKTFHHSLKIVTMSLSFTTLAMTMVDDTFARSLLKMAARLKTMWILLLSVSIVGVANTLIAAKILIVIVMLSDKAEKLKQIFLKNTLNILIKLNMKIFYLLPSNKIIIIHSLFLTLLTYLYLNIYEEQKIIK